MFFVIDLVDHQDYGLLRFAQHARKLFVDWRQAFFCIDDKKQKIAVAKRFLGGAANLRS